MSIPSVSDYNLSKYQEARSMKDLAIQVLVENPSNSVAARLHKDSTDMMDAVVYGNVSSVDEKEAQPVVVSIAEKLLNG